MLALGRQRVRAVTNYHVLRIDIQTALGPCARCAYPQLRRNGPRTLANLLTPGEEPYNLLLNAQ